MPIYIFISHNQITWQRDKYQKYKHIYISFDPLLLVYPCIPMVYRHPLPMVYRPPLPMVYRPTYHGISIPTTHGISTPYP